MTLNSNIPEGPLAEKWTKARFDNKLVNPSNKRRYEIIVVGAGDYFRARDTKLKAFPPHFFDQDRQVKFSTSRDFHTVRATNIFHPQSDIYTEFSFESFF